MQNASMPANTLFGSRIGPHTSSYPVLLNEKGFLVDVSIYQLRDTVAVHESVFISSRRKRSIMTPRA
jgi:hypothetical protein